MIIWEYHLNCTLKKFSDINYQLSSDHIDTLQLIAGGGRKDTNAITPNRNRSPGDVSISSEDWIRTCRHLIGFCEIAETVILVVQYLEKKKLLWRVWKIRSCESNSVARGLEHVNVQLFTMGPSINSKSQFESLYSCFNFPLHNIYCHPKNFLWLEDIS